ncbi:inovirus Gp2 family protein [Pectobacterium brasiliense]|uniref:inovirus Gp2 family protein n=2 Tax=Pectobacterium brasiliense TaxID=180957 RepID=UPI00057F7BF1|nr:DNA repair protein [Pectobacterium brasiliense]KHT02038.1 DNA repair protein [Pectobacterium brasiliense]MBN3099134.1 inovirus Gp2 family protein [Pectobacterium brasiliense]MBN3103891.1 inovirus Gp2 family protein [Pectobacterium brasiliense]MBN3166176.1 inovirus Gp2 family protein [Pectobacterium brasiliense]
MKKPSLGQYNYYYLCKFRSTLMNAMRTHPRTLAVRVDLHFPDDYCAEGNRAIGSFTPALKSRLRARYRRQVKKNHGKQTHQSDMHYIWVREHNQCGTKFHYHVLLMFNKDVFYTLGDYTQRGNLADMIIQAWCSALSLSAEKYRSLVTFPESPCYYLYWGSLNKSTDFSAIRSRIDYMAKNRDKQYSRKVRTMGCTAYC